MVFQCINIRQVPWEVLKTEAGVYVQANTVAHWVPKSLSNEQIYIYWKEKEMQGKFYS